MRTRITSMAAVASAAVLTGCGAQVADPPTAPTRSDATSTPDADPATAPGPSPARCGDGPIAVGVLDQPEAALGHRYLALVVRNCTDAPLVLDGRAEVATIRSDGRPLGVPDVASPIGVPRTVRVEPGGRAFVGVEWLAAVREPRWATGVSLTVPGVGIADLGVGNFDVNRDTTDIRVHPRAATIGDIWSS